MTQAIVEDEADHTFEKQNNIKFPYLNTFSVKISLQILCLYQLFCIIVKYNLLVWGEEHYITRVSKQSAQENIWT
jgi:hypothetical protein